MAINLTNRAALYDFLSTFSGTHYVTPRALADRIPLLANSDVSTAHLGPDALVWAGERRRAKVGRILSQPGIARPGRMRASAPTRILR